MLDPNHPIFHNILTVSAECYITIFNTGGDLYYRYVAPSRNIFPIDTGGSLGYPYSRERADHLLVMWPIYRNLTYGPPESPLALKIKAMDIRYKRRYELNHSR